MTSKKSIQFNFSYLHWSTVWCCQKIEELKIENLWTKNSLFPCHTQTNLKYISWNGKNTVQSTSKMIFNFLNSCFDKKLYGLIKVFVQYDYMDILLSCSSCYKSYSKFCCDHMLFHSFSSKILQGRANLFSIWTLFFWLMLWRSNDDWQPRTMGRFM